MEIVQPLVRAVARAFYPDEHVAVMDALLLPPYYIEDDSSTKGSLQMALGGLPALQVRRILQELERHSMVQVYERDNKRFFYVDYAHFCKVMRLRYAEFLKEQRAFDDAEVMLRSLEYQCGFCRRVFGVMDAQVNAFACPHDGGELTELVDASKRPAKAARGGGGADASSSAMAAVREKFKTQMNEAREQRDGIKQLLDRADAAANRIPENHPGHALSIKYREEFEAKLRERGVIGNGPPTSESVGSRESQLYANQQRAMLEVEQTKVTELPAWMKVSSVTGQATAEAMRHELEKEAGKRRAAAAAGGSGAGPGGDGGKGEAGAGGTGGDEYVQKFYESQMAAAAAAPPKDSGEAPAPSSAAAPATSTAAATTTTAEPEPEFEEDEGEPVPALTVGGVTKYLDEVTPEDQALMTPEEYAEYARLVAEWQS